MAHVKLLGNEVRKISIYKDNSVELTLNFGEIPNEKINQLYELKKKGEFIILIANIDDWVDSLIYESKVSLGEA